MKLSKAIQELTPIFEAYNLNPKNLKEFKQAIEIDKVLSNKVSFLLLIAGVQN